MASVRLTTVSYVFEQTNSPVPVRQLVTLELDGHGIPSPSSVSIPNKGYDVQSFQQATEFYIFVREANFQTENPWAAFTVFTVR